MSEKEWDKLFELIEKAAQIECGSAEERGELIRSEAKTRGQDSWLDEFCLTAVEEQHPHPLTRGGHMPVMISLKDLVQIEDAKYQMIWPEEFRLLCGRLATEHRNRTLFSAIADWLDEHDEPKLAKGCRVLARPDVLVKHEPAHKRWVVERLPSICGFYVNSYHSVIDLAAQIADNIQKAYDEIDGVLKPAEPLPEPDENRPDEGPDPLPLEPQEVANG